MVFKNLLRPFLDALYPPVCLLCGKDSEGSYPHCCPECFSAFEAVTACCPDCGLPYQDGNISHLCLACLIKRSPFAWCRSLYIHKDPLAAAIRRMKYGRSTAMIQPLVDAFLNGAARIGFPGQDLVVPVPMGYWRNIRRGFNQAHVLAEPLAGRLGLPIEAKALRRIGRPQVGLGKTERRKNASAAFLPGPDLGKVEGKRVLLVDDVYTTGHTVRSCARVLSKAGADVSVLTLARAAIWV